MTTTSQQLQTIFDQGVDARGAELRMQAIVADNTLKAMELHAMLEWFGADIKAGQSLNGFKTTVQSIRRWQEANA